MFNFSLRFAFNFQFISQSWLVHHNGLVLINYLSFVPGFHVLRFLSFHGLPMLPFNWVILRVDVFLSLLLFLICGGYILSTCIFSHLSVD